MYLVGLTSINKWVKELKDTPRYAYLSGFDPGRTPSKAYFSWFISNLFGNDIDIDDIMTQGTLLKKIFETAFVNKCRTACYIRSKLQIKLSYDLEENCKVFSFDRRTD
jgi:hypothetical protein